jgi:hypothetical protein
VMAVLSDDDDQRWSKHVKAVLHNIALNFLNSIDLTARSCINNIKVQGVSCKE